MSCVQRVVAPDDVIVITFGTASDENVVTMTTLRRHNHHHRYNHRRHHHHILCRHRHHFHQMLLSLLSLQALGARQRVMSLLEPHLANLLNQNTSVPPSRGLPRVIQAYREHQNKDLDLEEVKDLALEMLFAGQVTTSSAASFLLLHLGNHPHVLQRLRQDLTGAIASTGCLRDGGMMEEEAISAVLDCKYLEYVVKETLRMDPPAGGGYRRSFCTLEVGVSSNRICQTHSTDTRRNNNVVITLKDASASFWRNNDFIITSHVIWTPVLMKKYDHVFSFSTNKTYTCRFDPIQSVW